MAFYSSPYCVERLPYLFLKDGEHRELQGLMMLDPDWLIRAMKVVMKLDPKNKVPGVKSHQMTSADSLFEEEVLVKFWKEEFKSASGSLSDDGTHHLCLVLQAYCVIYPTTGGCADAKKYMIPCKFPEDVDIMKECTFVDGCATFYFDFQKFLPDEIYHKLICLASTEARPKECGRSNRFYAKCCIFYNLLGTNWVMELEEHKLKIRVIP